MRSTIPHNPEENDIDERINITIMDGALTILDEAHMPEEYWPLAVSDITLKHALMTHESTGKIPFQMWTRNTAPLPRLFIFGQLGRVKNLTYGHKLQARGTLARYVGINSINNFLIQMTNGIIMKIRHTDFHPVNKPTDPKDTHAHSFITLRDRISTVT